MRKIVTLLAAALLVVCMAFGVCANNISASEVRSFSTLSSDGGCQVSMTVTLDVRTAGQELYFPVPKEATNVTLNGTPVLTEKTAQARFVKLNRIIGKMSVFGIKTQLSMTAGKLIVIDTVEILFGNIGTDTVVFFLPVFCQYGSSIPVATGLKGREALCEH